MGKSQKVEWFFLPELCSLRKKKKEIRCLSKVYLTSSLCQTGLETQENVSPVRLLVLPASAHVVNVTSTYAAFHVVFQHACCHALPGFNSREMLKSTNH